MSFTGHITVDGAELLCMLKTQSVCLLNFYRSKRKARPMLSKTHAIQQRALLESAEPDHIHAICKYIYNIMHGTISIPESIKEELTPKK